jgi:hypothetical protein
MMPSALKMKSALRLAGKPVEAAAALELNIPVKRSLGRERDFNLRLFYDEAAV